MYNDTNKVLENIKKHFESLFSEHFEMERCSSDRLVTYKSDSYWFDVMAPFIQCRTKEDFAVSIEDRINTVLIDVTVKKNTHYRFITKSVNQHLPTDLPTEYSIDLIE